MGWKALAVQTLCTVSNTQPFLTTKRDDWSILQTLEWREFKKLYSKNFRTVPAHFLDTSPKEKYHKSSKET